jgi:hypothetical protein
MEACQWIVLIYGAFVGSVVLWMVRGLLRALLEMRRDRTTVTHIHARTPEPVWQLERRR